MTHCAPDHAWVKRSVHWALLVLAGVCFAPQVQALRCGSRIVDRGAYDVQVQQRCGAPFWRSQRAELLVQGSGGPIETRRERRIEDWYYNFGARRLMVRLRFIDGVLENEETLGYGAPSVGGRCSATAFSRGLSEGELVLRCGAPQSRRSTYADQVFRDAYGQVLVRPALREEWVYPRDDSQQWMRVILVEGRIESAEGLRP
jgi:hypothetical protein